MDDYAKKVKLTNRIQALRIRHEMLEARMSAERRRPLPNVFMLQRLRRRNRSIRQEMRFLKVAGHSIRTIGSHEAA